MPLPQFLENSIQALDEFDKYHLMYDICSP